MSDQAKTLDLTDVTLCFMFNGTPYYVKLDRTAQGEPLGSVHVEVVRSTGGNMADPDDLLHATHVVFTPDLLQTINGLVAFAQRTTAAVLAGEVKEEADGKN